jgi:type I restriction enzyme S subunit
MPEIRFPEFEGEWRPAKGRNAFGKRNAKGEAGLPIWSVTIDRGLVPRDSLERKGDDAADGSNLRAQPGDLVYNTMRMWQGAVGRATEECMLSPAYVVLAPKRDTVSELFEYWFKAPRMLHRLWAYSHGLTSDRLRLYYDDFAQIPMAMPTPAEQEKIAAFLGAVDARLEGWRREKALLADYKTGLMQRIFSRDLRFRADDGSAFPEWREMRLRDIVQFSKGRGISKEDIVEGGATPCIRYGQIYTDYGEVIRAVISSTNSPTNGLLLSQIGDVIIPASGEDPNDMARACAVMLEGVALGGDINVLRGTFDGPFMAYYLSGAKRREIARVAQGNSVVHLYGSHLADLRIELPHPEEQRKIADALGAIDSKIDAVAAQIDQLETFKRGLLQKMFV